MRTLADDLVVLPFALAVPDYASRLGQWKQQRNGDDKSLPDRELESVAARYCFNTAEIDDTMRLARGRTQMRAQKDRAVRIDNVLWACRMRSAANFGSLARVTVPRATWDDLVLPDDVLAALRELCAQVRQRARVLHEWGFDRRLSMGKGLHALFVGPSGTGKTLAAEVIASALGLGLVKVDLAGVVSKYIGETEKNLQRIFESAERSDAILFFDEADALFGKRSEVKDAHDRYANIEINFLLQRLEEYEGVVVLASNLAQNIDESFARRLHFTVEFPFPNEACREAIWRHHFPPETPVDPDVDLPWLAKQIKVPGGSIRNIVLNAAYLAADRNRPVQMDHLLQAARREFDKMGKPYLSEEFTGPAAVAVNGGKS